MAIIKDDSFYGEGDNAEGDKGGAGTMLSRSILGGRDIKPGDRIILRVTKVHDDEVAVEYATKGDDEADEAVPKGTPAEEPTDDNPAATPPPAEQDSIYA